MVFAHNPLMFIAVVFDGWGRHERDDPRAESEIKRETTIVEEILALVHTDIKAYNLIGNMSYERVAWVQAIDIYISPYCSGLFFPLIIANKPGVVHGPGYNSQTVQTGEFSPFIRENLTESIFLPADYVEEGQPQGFTNYDISWQKVYGASINLLKKISEQQHLTSEQESSDKIEDSLDIKKMPIEPKIIEEAIAQWREQGELNLQADNNSLLNSLEPISSFQILPEQLAIRSGEIVEKGSRKQLVSLTGNQDLVSYGPYINVPDGLYKIRVNFEFLEVDSDSDPVLGKYTQTGYKLDIATEFSYIWQIIDVPTRQDKLEFFLELVDANNLEIRFWATGRAFAINSIELNLLYPPMAQDLAADYFFELGKYLQFKGKQEHGGRLHRRVAEVNPEVYLDKAIAYWKQARETEPNWITYFNLGMLPKNLGNPA